jgi:hypothetical protein
MDTGGERVLIMSSSRQSQKARRGQLVTQSQPPSLSLITKSIKKTQAGKENIHPSNQRSKQVSKPPGSSTRKSQPVLASESPRFQLKQATFLPSTQTEADDSEEEVRAHSQPLNLQRAPQRGVQQSLTRQQQLVTIQEASRRAEQQRETRPAVNQSSQQQQARQRGNEEVRQRGNEEVRQRGNEEVRRLGEQPQRYAEELETRDKKIEELQAVSGDYR